MKLKHICTTVLFSAFALLKADLPGEWQAYFFDSENTTTQDTPIPILPQDGVIKYKGKTIYPEKVLLENDRFDLDQLAKKRGESAVLVGTIQSDEDRKTWIGVGGLSFTCRVNGKLVYDISWKGLGNDYDPVRSTDHIFPVELKKGENIIVFESLRTHYLLDHVYGKDRKITWHLAVKEYADYTPRKAELAHPELLIRPDKGAVQLTFLTKDPVPAGVDYRIKGAKEWIRQWDTAGDLVLREKTGIHRIRLEKLEPDTEYEYRLVLLEPPAGTDGFRRPLWSARQYKEVILPVKTFQTFGDKKEYSFFVLGDTQLSLSETCKTAKARAGFMKKMQQIPAFQKADFVVHIGDMDSYFHDIGKTLFGDFFDLFARPEKPIQWVYVRGNHEVNGIGAEDWFDYFQMPGDKTYYAFRKGDVFYIVLDCGDFSSGDTVGGQGCLISMSTLYAAQTKWLNRIRQSEAFKKAKFRVVLAHPEPQCESGAFNDSMRKMTADLLKDTSPEGLIHLWIGGHVHKYWRMVRGSNELIHMYPAKRWALTEAPVTWVTVDAPKGNSSWPNFSYLNVEVKENLISVSAYDQDGKRFDQFSVDEKGSVTEHFRRDDLKILKLTK